MTITTHNQAVHDQFNPQSASYLRSAVHAQGPDLERARELVSRSVSRQGQALDIGCGAGHLSFALARMINRVVAYDASEAMLKTVRATAADRQLKAIETRQGHAELLPFADKSFDLVATRYSSHHWSDLDKAMKEMRRVVRPGGFFLVIDVETWDNPLIDTYFQAIELLRDRSHVRDRSDAEWCQLFQKNGFVLLEHARWPVRLEFTSWLKRMRTPSGKAAMIRTLQNEAPEEVRAALNIEEDGSFFIQTGLWWGKVPF